MAGMILAVLSNGNSEIQKDLPVLLHNTEDPNYSQEVIMIYKPLQFNIWSVTDKYLIPRRNSMRFIK